MSARSIPVVLYACLAAPVTAGAAPPPDPSSTVTIQIENDATTGTDRYYTAGERLAWTSPTGAVGTWRIYGVAGGDLRLGQGLASDFGAPRIQPGMTGADAYVAVRPFAWYVFFGVDGQAVAFDETLDGEPFRHTAHVSEDPLVGELEGGLVVIAWGTRINFVEVAQTQGFRGQTSGLFKFSSASISVKF